MHTGCLQSGCGVSSESNAWCNNKRSNIVIKAQKCSIQAGTVGQSDNSPRRSSHSCWPPRLVVRSFDARRPLPGHRGNSLEVTIKNLLLKPESKCPSCSSCARLARSSWRQIWFAIRSYDNRKSPAWITITLKLDRVRIHLALMPCDPKSREILMDKAATRRLVQIVAVYNHSH